MSNDRRTFLKTLSASVLAPALPSRAAMGSAAAPGTLPAQPTPARASAPHAAPKRPNVVLMICDDLGPADLGCYGSALPTPNLDRLAAAGVRCDRYNAAHPICSASRGALLTGRYAPRSHTAGALFPKQKGPDLDEQLLPLLFRQAGYQTHAIGKWHLGDVPGYFPTDRGFDSFLGVPYSDDMQPLPLYRDTVALEPDTDRDQLTPRYTEEALRLLNSAGSTPFFLYVAYSYPHDPARASARFRGKTDFGDYGDSVAEIDWSVGQILDTLDRTGHADDTIVIFTSDHGPWFQGSPGAVRGRKGSTFEGGVRIPFLLRYAPVVSAGILNRDWIGHLDILPTLSAWCGLPRPRLPLDGHDITATLTHGTPPPERSAVYFAIPGGKNDVHCLRSGPWKLRVAQGTGEIYTNDHTMGPRSYLLPKPELYHLDRDPTESYDCAAKFPERVQAMLGTLEDILATMPPETRDAWATLKGSVASVVTPPGAAPRILNGPQPAWAWEPPDRRP